MKKYEGPIEVGMVFTAPDNDGQLGYRRVRLLARHPFKDGTLIIEEMKSRMKGRREGEIFPCPEANLRFVFEPEASPPE